MTWTPQISTLKDYLSLLADRGNLLDCPLLGSSEVKHSVCLKTEARGSADNHTCPDSSVSTSAPDDDPIIKHLSYDSRTVREGTLFFCKGAHFEPRYLLAALDAGAVAYVSECDYSTLIEQAGKAPVPSALVREIRPALSECAALFYRGLLSHLTLIGFTGTKGKSTTTYMLRCILDSWLKEQGKAQSAWLSGIENYDGYARSHSLLTTQDVLELYTHFEHAVSSDIEYLTMEVSSQALKYGRTSLIPFEVVGFLNIGSDHISDIEHDSQEDYFTSKLAIFKQGRRAVVNRQTDELDRVLEAAATCEKTLTFGLDSTADVRASEIATTAEGLSFLVSTDSWHQRFTIPMAGRFNVENALAAITAALALGVPVKHLSQGLASCEVSGRMQLVSGPDGKLIIIDYAHNKLSFETIFSTVVRDYPGRPVVCVFGATGSKGIERRLDLPAVAARYAEMIYITEDDPGEESLEAINQQIARVVEASGKAYRIIEDRDEAIACAIDESSEGSLVLVLGKGHETVMRRGRESVAVATDRKRVEAVLSKYGPQ